MDQSPLEQVLQEAKLRSQGVLGEKVRGLQRDQQVTMGFCNVIPHPKVATQPFHSELTIEQNSLFVANRYPGDHFVREWTIEHPESGEPVLRRVIVGKTDLEERSWGVLRQVHQDVFYRLLQLWAEHGYKLGEIDGKIYGSLRLSAYELVQAIWGSDSQHHYRRTRALLHEMSAIPVVLENVYSWQGMLDRIQFSLLGAVHWEAKRIDKETGQPKTEGKSEVTVLFSSMVTESFLQKHVKTLLGNPYRSLGIRAGDKRGEIAKLLYPFLDAQLATKESFHCRLASLFERFGLGAYSKKSDRKRKFQSALRSLNGQLILGERYRLHVRLQNAADGSDYVLLARREQTKQLRLFRE